jgi:hypothetical protein
MEGDALWWLVTWCRMCGSSFGFTCRLIMLTVIGDCPVHCIKEWQGKDSTVLCCCCPGIPISCQKRVAYCHWFQICYPKPQHLGHNIVLVFWWSLVSPVGTCQLTCYMWGIFSGRTATLSGRFEGPSTPPPPEGRSVRWKVRFSSFPALCWDDIQTH